MAKKIMFEDPWGNVFETEQAYKAHFAQEFNVNHDEIIAEDMNIPGEVMEWITDDPQRAISFGVTFKEDIDRIREAWIEDNWNERYEFFA